MNESTEQERIRRADTVEKAIEEIEYGRYDRAVSLLGDYISAHPEAADEAFRTEMRAIELLIRYRRDLEEWDYFRALKLTYAYFEKTYAAEELLLPSPSEISQDCTRDIWWCWLQGLENAPAVVRACFHSLKKLNRTIHIITADNFREYVSMPEYIVRKWKDGIIGNAHFADALRLELLTTRGGIWIDATVYVTGFEEMTGEAPLFAYAYIMHDATRDYILYGNWLMKSNGYSRILWETKQMLYRYWEREEKLLNYFIFHLFFTIACRRNREERSFIPTYSDAPCHVMQLELTHPYTETRWRQLLSMTPVHKLTWRYDSSAQQPGTVLDHIIS